MKGKGSSKEKKIQYRWSNSRNEGDKLTADMKKAISNEKKTPLLEGLMGSEAMR